MGHKVHPTGFRLGVVKGWQSRWYAERDYKDILAEDFLIRRVINKDLFNASVSRIEIERAAANQVLVRIHTAKPGIVIGKNGEKVDKLRTQLEARTKKRVRLEIMEIRQPELDAYLVGRGIAEQLEKRVSFRRAMKQAVQKSMRANAKGIKIVVGGRLGGAEIARSEKEVEGKVPLQTLRADIDYGLTEAHTTFGVIGIKVWIYRGDILPTKRREAIAGQQETVAQPFSPREERRGGERGERGERGGERRGDRRDYAPRGDRSQGERGQRPQGDRSQGERPRGERSPRPQGERPPRPQGQGERGERSPRPQGERGERPPRQQGQQGERVAHAEQAAQTTGEFPAPQATVPPVTQPEATQPSPQPSTQPTPAPEAPASDTSGIQETQGE